MQTIWENAFQVIKQTGYSVAMCVSCLTLFSSVQ
jgi:hypothetical protein